MATKRTLKNIAAAGTPEQIAKRQDASLPSIEEIITFDPSDVGVERTPSPVAPEPETPIVGGSQPIRDEIDLVKGRAGDLLDDFESIQDMRQQTVEENLKGLQDALSETQRLMRGEFTGAELADIEAEGAAAGAEFDPAIARARESARQGTARATVLGGERGGFLSTQIAGQSALTPTEGDTFGGRGGEISRVRGQLEQNIAILEAEKNKAINAAKAAARKAKQTGSRQAFQDAQTLFAAANEAAKMREDAIAKRIDLIGQEEANERARITFDQTQADRVFSDLGKVIQGGGEVPTDMRATLDQRFGEGFTDQYTEAARAASEASGELETLDKITGILNRIPQGQEITIGEQTYKGLGSDKSGNKTYSEEDAFGNVTYVTVSPQGEIINQASGGRIGKGFKRTGGTGSGATAEETEREIRELGADMIKQIDTGKLTFPAAFDIIKTRFPQIPNDAVNELLGGGIPFDPETGTFDTERAFGRAVAQEEE